MFGANKTAPLRLTEDGQALIVKEVFPTIQGEGPLTGVPAVFVRLGGCNLKCWFCDTDFTVEGDTTTPLVDLLNQIQEVGEHWENINHVVITGGEPMIQNLVPLVRGLHEQSWKVQIETAGTIMVPGLFDNVEYQHERKWEAQRRTLSLVCSPKTPNVHPLVEEYCNDWKYIVRVGEVSEDDGLPMRSTQHKDKPQRLFRPHDDGHARIWVQPAEEYDVLVAIDEFSTPGVPRHRPNRERTKANVDLAARVAMQYGYRLSLQTHKVIGLP